MTNIRSLRYKLDELETVMTTNKIDICCVAESWLDTNIPDEAISISGYSIYRRDRGGEQRGGGVVCYVSSTWPCVRLEEFDNPDLETLWLLIRRPTMPRCVSHIVMCVVYHPPAANSRQLTSHIIKCLDSITQQHPYAGIILLGDVNQLNDSPLRSYPLRQLVNRPTRNEATLDKIYTNINQYNSTANLPNIGSSDHRAVVLSADHSADQTGPRYIEMTVRSKDTNGRNLLANALYNYNWDVLESMDSVDDKVNFFTDTVMSLLNYYLPTYTVKRHVSDKPWISEEFRRLIRQRQHALKSGQLVRYRQLRNKVNRESKKLRQKFYTDKVQQLRQCDNSKWWRNIKTITGQSTKQDISVLANSETDGNIQLLTERINESLRSVSADLSPLSDTSDEIVTSGVDNQSFVRLETIHVYDVFQKLSRINIRKSNGPDNVPNWLLRDMAFVLAEPICHLFNSSVKQQVMPSSWKRADVVVIPKKSHAKSIESDLRPISLTPTLSKILESYYVKWILEKTHDQFDTYQFGGLKGKSTTHELVHYLHICHKAAENNQCVRSLFIDYSKAFDHIDHTIVLRKMSDCGIHPGVLQWMRSFLSGRQQRVKIGKNRSQWTTLNGGVPQGSKLGPYIFLIHINDLELAQISSLFKFIDDVTATEVLSRDQSSNLQSITDSISDWSTDNNMNINIRKTKEMLIDMSTNKTNHPLLHINNVNIERVSSFKLLGVTIQDNLKWNEHVQQICTKANRRLHFLKLLKRSSMPTDELLYFYKTIIRSTLEYACPAWQSSLTKQQMNELESVQRRAVNIISADNDYDFYCVLYQLEYVSTRLDNLARNFFMKTLNPTDCISNLYIEYKHLRRAALPNTRDRSNRHDRLYDVKCRTERFKNSFIPYSINNFQDFI